MQHAFLSLVFHLALITLPDQQGKPKWGLFKNFFKFLSNNRLLQKIWGKYREFSLKKEVTICKNCYIKEKIVILAYLF